jgi:spore coat protein U-like protein
MSGRATQLAAAMAGCLIIAPGGSAYANCRFQSGSTTGAMGFGTLVPGSGATATAQTSLNIRCSPAADFALLTVNLTSANGGAGTYQMLRIGGGASIAYGLSYSAVLETSTPQRIDARLIVSGTIAPAAYNNALSGSYLDTLTILVGP